jgi:hypothetical protein
MRKEGPLTALARWTSLTAEEIVIEKEVNGTELPRKPEKMLAA